MSVKPFADGLCPRPYPNQRSTDSRGRHRRNVPTSMAHIEKHGLQAHVQCRHQSVHDLGVSIAQNEISRLVLHSLDNAELPGNSIFLNSKSFGNSGFQQLTH